MPFGKHKGKALANVPAHYLLWVRADIYSNRPQPKSPLSVYIEENLNDLKLEAKQVDGKG